MQNTISTKTVASMLNVNESTVKRWADKNILKCIKTPGGHRNFRLEDIVEHSETFGIKLPQLSSVVRLTKSVKPAGITNPDAAVKILAGHLVKGDADESYHLIYSLYLDKIGIACIFDDVIKRSFEIISELWKGGSKGVDAEHIATNTAIQALFKLQSVISPTLQKNRTVICAGLENEHHSIGLLCVKISLEQLGYKVVYPGTNLPLNSLEDLIKSSKPDAVCISTTVPENDQILKSKIKRLAGILKKQGILFLVGGSNVNIPVSKNQIYCDSIGELIKRIRNLK